MPILCHTLLEYETQGGDIKHKGQIQFKSCGQRPLVRATCRWEDNIKKHI